MEYLHVSVEINGVKLEVIGNYWPGEAESMDGPGESESVEIEQVLTANGDDIGAMVAWFDGVQECVELAAIDALKQGRIWQRCEADIARREMAREDA